ncbi:MAG: hypothetical protein WCS52_00460 [bacterium]
MNFKIQSLIILMSLLAMANGYGANQESCILTGWGIDEKNPEAFIANARAIGFDELIAGSTDPAFLKKAVDIGKTNNIKIFSCLHPITKSMWEKYAPTRPVPWQKMTEDEEAARKFIATGNNRYIIPYQFGGEPIMSNEVLAAKILCLSDMDARELLKPIIDDIVTVPGIEGVAFDGFGYQNYRRCYCEHCQSLLEDYSQKHPEIPKNERETIFFRDALVDYINYLADYARSKNRNIKTSIHIWPVFTQEPLYGNRLDIDYCGQTAAWYTLWPEGKIAEYSRIISQEAKKYHPRQQGVGMIGYYDLPGQFPVKDANRVDMELRTMIHNGCYRIQVCGAQDVINNKEVSAVFRKYFE